MKLSTIIQYSTLDFKFLEANLQQSSKFSDEIIIPICSHLFGGELENADLLKKSEEIVSKYAKAKILYFDWKGHHPNTAYYHTLSRAIGTQYAQNPWLLFLDTDELIIDGFKDWLDRHAFKTSNSFWLTCCWYFREPIYQADLHEGAALLIKKEQCNWNLDIRAERQQLWGPHKQEYSIYKEEVGESRFVMGGYEKILNKKGVPYVHHYSWVRTKKEMLQKVKNWGHCNDRDWESLINEEFNRPFNGEDFVHLSPKRKYNTVDNFFNIALS